MNSGHENFTSLAAVASAPAAAVADDGGGVAVTLVSADGGSAAAMAATCCLTVCGGWGVCGCCWRASRCALDDLLEDDEVETMEAAESMDIECCSCA